MVTRDETILARNRGFCKDVRQYGGALPLLGESVPRDHEGGVQGLISTVRYRQYEASVALGWQRGRRSAAEAHLGSGLFSRVPCKKSRREASGAATLARRHLRPDPGGDVVAWPTEYRAHVSARGSQAGRLLSVVTGADACGRREGSAFGDSADRTATSAALRLSADHGGTAAGGDAGESQTRFANHARR